MIRFSLSLALFLVMAPLSAQAHGSRPASLPLGDGHISFVPQRGYVFACQTAFAGGGAYRDGPWIKGQVWYPDGKIQVGGDVPWPQARLQIQTQENTRVLRGNGLPVNETTGIYPVRENDEAYQYDRNPNAITEQLLTLSLPRYPQLAEKPSCVPMGMIGITRIGVSIYNALDGMGRDAGAHEIQDRCNGHPERQGQYHFHNWSECLPDVSGAEGKHSDLVGYMIDGFGLYGLRGEGGKLLTNRDLDECHGHSHTVLWDGEMIEMYHYHFTYEYPYTAGCLRGTPQMPPARLETVGSHPSPHSKGAPAFYEKRKGPYPMPPDHPATR